MTQKLLIVINLTVTVLVISLTLNIFPHTVPMLLTTLFKNLELKLPRILLFKNHFSTSVGVKMKYLSQAEAIQIDQELFGEYKFSVEQLMEMAGLSVAQVIARTYPTIRQDAKKVLVVCGPGNNGGDGLVAARHLKLYGFPDVTIVLGRKPKTEMFANLTHQAAENDVQISYNPDEFVNDKSIGLVVDGLFGFSFKPPVRAEFQPLMKLFTESKAPIVAIDIPSGWDVEKGPSEDKSIYFMPDTLVSLTAPKNCASHFKGPNHYLGGRFVPEKLAKKYSLQLPKYPDIDCIVKL